MEEALSGLGESCGSPSCAAKPLSNTVSKKISIWFLVLAYVDAASRICFGRGGTLLETFNHKVCMTDRRSQMSMKKPFSVARPAAPPRAKIGRAQTLVAAPAPAYGSEGGEIRGQTRRSPALDARKSATLFRR